jgi:hypothetical protein
MPPSFCAGIAGARCGDTVTTGGQSRHVVGYMKDFLSRPEQARIPVGVLSDGERARDVAVLAPGPELKQMHVKLVSITPFPQCPGFRSRIIEDISAVSQTDRDARRRAFFGHASDMRKGAPDATAEFSS